VKQIITAKLKLETNKEQFKELTNLSLAYCGALNFGSNKAFELDKTTNANLLHKSIYRECRDKFGLPSQLACSVSRYVTASYKTLWTITNKNIKARKNKETKRVYKGLNKAPKYISRTTMFQYGRDFTFKKDQQISIITLNGRILLDYKGWNKHLNLIKDENTKIGGAKLYYDKAKKTFYLLVSLEIETQEEKQINTIGIDLGQRYLAVVTDTQDNTLFIPGKECINQVGKYQRVRSSLQKKIKTNKKNGKGTRSITRKLIQVKGQERRYRLSLNHQTASSILQRFPNSNIGLENLKDIRTRTERHSSKKDSKKRKEANRNKASWSFNELQQLIEYKANLYGSKIFKVDAHYTSQMCTKCGYTSKENRPKSGLNFICCNCNFKLHADLIGARNIAMRTLLSRQDLDNKGHLSIVPVSGKAALDTSNSEVKAESLKKYSELRWSSEANLT